MFIPSLLIQDTMQRHLVGARADDPVLPERAPRSTRRALSRAKNRAAQAQQKPAIARS